MIAGSPTIEEPGQPTEFAAPGDGADESTQSSGEEPSAASPVASALPQVLGLGVGAVLVSRAGTSGTLATPISANLRFGRHFLAGLGLAPSMALKSRNTETKNEMNAWDLWIAAAWWGPGARFSPLLGSRLGLSRRVFPNSQLPQEPLFNPIVLAHASIMIHLGRFALVPGICGGRDLTPSEPPGGGSTTPAISPWQVGLEFGLVAWFPFRKGMVL